MGRFNLVIAVLSLSLSVCFFPDSASAQLRQKYYANICPNVEDIVRNVVNQKFKQTFVTVPATLRMFFHDCFVQVCIIFVLNYHKQIIRWLSHCFPENRDVMLQF